MPGLRIALHDALCERRVDGALHAIGQGRQRPATGGYRFLFRLLTGGLLVRIQPERQLCKVK